MIYFLGGMGLIAWLSLGLLSYKATNDLVEVPLETLPLPLRLVAIIFAPIGLLIYERHLFRDRAKPEMIVEHSERND